MATFSIRLVLALLCYVAFATAQNLTPANGTSSRAARQYKDRIGLEITRSDGLPTPSVMTLIPLVDGALRDLPVSGQCESAIFHIVEYILTVRTCGSAETDLKLRTL